MIQSLLIYFLLAFIMSRLGRRIYLKERFAIYHEQKSRFLLPEMVLLLLFFALLCGIRWNVGVDHLAYLRQYEFLIRKTVSYEPLFLLVSKTMRSMDVHFVFYFALLAGVQVFFVYYALKNEKYLYVFLPCVLIFGPYYSMWMNGIRQMIAACIFVYAIEFIVDKKLLKYIVLIVVCSFIHKSALILLLIYFLPNKDIFKQRYITMVLVVFCYFLGQNPTFMSASQTLSDILSFLDYGWYADNLGQITKNIEVTNIGIRTLSILITCLLVIWFSPCMKTQFDTKTFLFYYNLFILYAMANGLMPKTSVLYRPFMYFLNFTMIMTAYLLYYLYSKGGNSRNILFGIVFLIVILFNIYDNYEASGLSSESVLFKFFWDYK